MTNPIGYYAQLWPRIPTTVDELGRVMYYVCGKDLDGTENNPSVGGWKCAPSDEVDPNKTVDLRFRVMVNESKKVAFVAFRGTKLNDYKDLLLDAHIMTESQFCSAFRGDERCVVDKIKKFFTENVLDCVRKLDLMEGVEKANNYVGDHVKNWAEKKEYSLVIGGYSLGGFIAQYIGYQQNLHTVTFDGLWGAMMYCHKPLEAERVQKCFNLIYHTHTIINCSDAQIGTIGTIYRVNPSDSTKQALGCAWLTYLGHDLRFFFDYESNPNYSGSLITTGISEVSLEALRCLQTAEEHFLRDDSCNGAFYFFNNSVPSDLRNKVYYKMYLTQRCYYGEVWRLGEMCFCDGLPGCSSYHYSSTNQERAEAIRKVMMTY